MQRVEGRSRQAAPAPWICFVGGKTTTQDVYFYFVGTAKAHYLSLEACKSLGLIPDDFPHHSRAVATVGGLHVTKDLRPRPSEVPLTPLEENVARLEEWLLRHSSSTVFNTSRSPLSVMAGAPHRIHLKPGAATNHHLNV